ncbi:hypothetical protein [Winslowiella toletana]|nr:hypothetical protein [Winslowiella toletana]
MDAYIQSMSFNFLEFPKRTAQILELVTHNPAWWRRLIHSADQLLWIKDKGYGWAVYRQTTSCGFIRLYRFKPSATTDHTKTTPWSEGNWQTIKSESELAALLATEATVFVFEQWKKHQLEVNRIPADFARGRLANTAVSQAIIVAKGNGCAICGDAATHRASTTMGAEQAVMLSVSLCAQHENDVQQHPCVLAFFASLFFLKLDIPDLIKLDYIPETLTEPMFALIAANLQATFTPPEKRSRGWNVKFCMADGWSWRLRINSLMDYAYMLFDADDKQRHRIDSAPDHPDVPWGPDHQHYAPKPGKKHRIEPSFTYGVPIFDFPLLEKAKQHYQNQQ